VCTVPDLSRNDRRDDHGEESEVEDEGEKGEKGEKGQEGEKGRSAQGEAPGGEEERRQEGRARQESREAEAQAQAQGGCAGPRTGSKAGGRSRKAGGRACAQARSGRASTAAACAPRPTAAQHAFEHKHAHPVVFAEPYSVGGASRRWRRRRRGKQLKRNDLSPDWRFVIPFRLDDGSMTPALRRQDVPAAGIHPAFRRGRGSRGRTLGRDDFSSNRHPARALSGSSDPESALALLEWPHFLAENR
jgi:hypothetical protein